MDQAIELMADWCRAQPVPGMRVEVRRLPGCDALVTSGCRRELPDAFCFTDISTSNPNSQAGCLG